MGDIVVEDILAEPDEIGYLAATFALVHNLIRKYGWYLLLGLVGSYYLLRNRWRASAAVEKTPQELESWKSKEEQRLKAIQRLQQKYEEDAAIKAEKQKLLDEKKKKDRMAELEKLTASANVNKLGCSPSPSKSLRPEYSPLMGGGNSDNERVCYRRPGGGSSG